MKEGFGMHILAVDNDPSALNILKSCLRAAFPKDDVSGFTDPMLAGKYAFNNNVGAIFTETKMKPVDGFALIKVIRKHRPAVSVNFVTESPGFEQDAFRIMADSFIIKPLTLEKLSLGIGGKANDENS